MTALPPARLSSAMMAAAGTAVGAAAADAQDAALVARLDWVRTWTESVAAEDGDEGCRKMAAACRCGRALSRVGRERRPCRGVPAIGVASMQYSVYMCRLVQVRVLLKQC